MKQNRFIIFTLCLVLCASMAFAQGTTSTLTGTVTSEGRGLPGVSVTIASPAMQGTRTTVTADNGAYTFPGIPPGSYTVTFELEGMQRVTKSVNVRLAQVERVDASMALGAIAEAITVTAAAPTVLETTTISRNFTGEIVDKLPVARTIRDTVLLAPGVSSSGVNAQITISGAPSHDNLFLVNGVVVNENLRGQPHNLFIEDAIQETSVLTGAVSAEYGRFTGGVVSTITKSGGNQFSGSFRDSLTNPDWRKKTPHPTEADHLDDISETYEATLGGYIMRDRLWFFGAGRLIEQTIQRFTTFTNIPYVFGNDEKRYEAKLTGQITPKHNAVVSYLEVANDQTNQGFLNIVDLNTVTDRSLPNDLMSLRYSGIFGTNFLLEANFSEKNFTFEKSGGKDTSRINGTWLYDLSRGVFANAPVFCGVCTTGEERNNDAFVAKASYFLSTGMGTHNIVGGVEDFSETRKSNNFQSASQFEMFLGGGHIVGDTWFPRFDTGTTFRYRPIFELSPGTDFQTQSVFLNDRWDINNNWSANLGVRFDKNDGHDASGNLISDDSEISPRLGLIYDLQGNGRHRFNFSYGTYVSKIADGNVGGSGQAAGNPSLFSWTYRGPAINPTGTPANELISTREAMAMVFAWFESIGGIANRNAADGYLGSFIAGFTTIFPESISSPAVDEIVLGYGTQIGRSGYVRVDAVNREWKNFYAGRLNLSTGRSTDPEGIQSDLAHTINEDSETFREYEGIQLYGIWRPGRFNIGGGYTWSELKGNDDGEGAGTATIRNLPLATWYPEYLSYAQRRPSGFLGQDQTHRARVWVGYELPTPVGNFNLSVLQRYDSGAPYSAVGNIDASGRIVAFPGLISNPGYVRNQLGTSHNYFFSERGAFRTEDEHGTDVSINYTLPIRRVNLFLNTGIRNIFDQDSVVNPNTTNIRTRRQSGAGSGLIAFNPFSPLSSLIECPQGAAAAQCSAMGAHWQKGTTFGQPVGISSYQIPLEYSFTVGLRF
ncbi:MAG TPA: TonB-dependent receptor [Thermoanaerobaculia bacterium]|nr:TonB-dependent receptor [Thermoanaerobaculia bacterium]